MLQELRNQYGVTRLMKALKSLQKKEGWYNLQVKEKTAKIAALLNSKDYNTK